MGRRMIFHFQALKPPFINASAQSHARNRSIPTQSRCEPAALALAVDRGGLDSAAESRGGAEAEDASKRLSEASCVCLVWLLAYLTMQIRRPGRKAYNARDADLCPVSIVHTSLHRGRRRRRAGGSSSRTGQFDRGSARSNLDTWAGQNKDQSIQQHKQP